MSQVGPKSKKRTLEPDTVDDQLYPAPPTAYNVPEPA